MMNYFSSKKKWMAYLVLLTFVFTCIVPTGTVFAAGDNTSQIVYAGGTKYYDANGQLLNNATGLGKNGAVVKLSKELDATGQENVFDITLTVETTLKQEENFSETSTPDAAVVLTIDMSGTMYRNKMDGQRYVDVAKAKATDFVNQFASSATEPDVKRMLAVVCFDTDAKIQQNWIDVSTASGLATATKAIDNIKVADNGDTSSTQVCTNFDGGVILTRNLLKQSTVQAIDKRFAIILSDGAPTVTVNNNTDTVGTIKSSFWDDQLDADGNKYQNARAGGGWTHPAEVARTKGYLAGVAAETTSYYATTDTTKTNPIEGIFIIGVGGLMDFKLFHDAVYGTSNGTRTSDVKNKPGAFNNVDVLEGYTSDQIMKMTTGDWMTALVSSVGGEYVSATNSAALASEFANILNAIASVTETWQDSSDAWSATDPIGTGKTDCVGFLGFWGKANASAPYAYEAGNTKITNNPDGDKATYKNSQIDWDLKESSYETIGTSTKPIYKYQIKYRLRLANEESGFKEEKAYDTNGKTTFAYQAVVNNEFGPVRTVDFPIPEVEGYLGEFAFTKTDEAGNPLTGADFKLVHAADCACDNVIIGDIADDTTTTDAVHNFVNIPSGHKYTLEEITPPTGYAKTDKTYIVTVSYGDVTVTENGTKVYDSVAGDKIMTVANKSTLTEVAVEKVWDDADNQDGIRPQSITVKLLADKQETGKSLTLNESNDWRGSFTKLEKYSGNKEIAYTVAEVAVTDYSTDITGNAETGFIITNTHTPETVDVTGEKTWDDADNQDGIRPASITVNLHQNGSKDAYRTVTVKPDSDGNWEYKFGNLPKCANGEEIKYTVSENTVDGYTTEVSGYNITNSHTPATVNKTVTKVWEDNDNQDGIRPVSVTVQLMNGRTAVGSAVTLDEGNNWSYTWEGLPKYAGSTTAIDYTVAEVEVPAGYTSKVTDDSVGNEFIVTNTHTPELTEATIVKVWNDGNEQYGIRPGNLEVFLSNGQSVTLNAENNWTATIKELPKYADGQEIAYTWREVSVPGYELTGSVTNGTVTTLTNTIVQSYFNIEGTKLWKDEAGNAIADPGVTSVEIQLFQNDEPYATATATTSNWTFEFKDVPRYNIDTVNGTVEKYEYRVAEVTTVAGYVPSYEVEKGEGNVINMTITNTRTYVEPGYMDITVEKQWDDNDNAQGKRPAEIEVTLYQNGNEYQTVKVTAEDNWMYSFEELPECNDEGKPYSYTVAEKEVEGYISLIVPTADGYKLINTLYTDQIGQFAVGKKVSAGTNAPAADTEYGFLLRIEALQENWSDVLDGQYKQLEKEKAIAEDNAEAAAAKVTEAEDAFRTSATAFTTGSAYRFIMAEKPVATSGSAYEYEYTIADWYGRIFTEVTTGSAYMWEGLGAAEDADSVIDAVIKAIKELAKELSSVFQRTVFMDALNSLMDAENSTPSALGFHTADADALLFAERNRIAADELVAEREQAMKDFRFDATTPSAITVVLTPNEDNSTREEVVFDLTPESKYYDAETKSYFVDFTLFQNTGYTVTIEATTGTMVKYVVSEVSGFEADANADYTYDGTDVAVNGEKLADDSLVRNTGALDMVKGIANSITFTNKYSNKVVEEETTTPEEEKKTEEKKEETKKDDPEEIIPDEDVPKGSVEIPGEILEELDDPEIPLGDAPATGDTNNAVPFMALMLAAIAGLAITRRKFN